jgi:hypothetical protein
LKGGKEKAATPVATAEAQPDENNLQIINPFI